MTDEEQWEESDISGFASDCSLLASEEKRRKKKKKKKKMQNNSRKELSGKRGMFSKSCSDSKLTVSNVRKLFSFYSIQWELENTSKYGFCFVRRRDYSQGEI